MREESFKTPFLLLLKRFLTTNKIGINKRRDKNQGLANVTIVRVYWFKVWYKDAVSKIAIRNKFETLWNKSN